MRKTIVTSFGEHRIVVSNSWFGGADLYVDGEHRDHKDGYFAFGREPFLRTWIDGVEVTVFIQAIMTVKVMIVADGDIIGGELFENGVIRWDAQILRLAH